MLWFLIKIRFSKRYNLKGVKKNMNIFMPANFLLQVFYVPRVFLQIGIDSYDLLDLSVVIPAA